VFGGTFDPPHHAHIKLARDAMEHLRCDKVLFVIAATSPFKQTVRQSSDEHRLAMLKLAIADQPWAEICTIELNRGGTSYTIDTLESLKQEFGQEVQLHLLIGEDQAVSFDEWCNNEAIQKIANVVVLARKGYESDRFETLPFEEIPISSTHIRERSSNDQSIEDLVSPTVFEYIAIHNLYE
jgi:nicotinate-nucleotide adenylyltransferase